MRWAWILWALGVAGCAAFRRGEGLDPGTLPVSVRADYEVFADRCARCHSLSRPLTARVDSPRHWREYVTRMRAMPGSGIAPEDEPALLRFLDWYSASRRDAPADAGAGGSS